MATTKTTQDRWWPAAVARELQVSRETVRKLILRSQVKRRVMPYLVGTRIGPGGCNWYVSEASVQAYCAFLAGQGERAGQL